MKHLTFILLIVLITSCNQQKKETENTKETNNKDLIINGKYYNSGFNQGKGNYNGITYASDGLVYYVLCSGHLDTGAQMYCLDPKSDEITFLGDLTEACGEKGMKAIPQGKCHNILFEYKGKLYFGTHTDHYSENDGKIEVIGTPPEGYQSYPGGHLLSFDLKTRKFEDLGIIPSRDGVISLTMDIERGILYGISWPLGYVFAYNVETNEMRDIGPKYGLAESVVGEGRHGISRAPVVSYADHKVYFCDTLGGFFTYDYETDKSEKFIPEGYDTKRRTWRQAVWSYNDNAIYANLYSSNILLRIDPIANTIDSVTRMISDVALKENLIFDSGLGLAFDKTGDMLYYVAVAPGNCPDVTVLSNQKMKTYKAHHHEDYNLISYNIKTKKRIDHGTIVLQNGVKPIHVNCLAVGDANNFYGMSYLNLQKHKTTTEVISFYIK